MSSRENSKSRLNQSYAKFRHHARTGRNIFMCSTQRRTVGVIFACTLLICGGEILVRSHAPSPHGKTAGTKKSAPPGGAMAGHYPFNTIGGANINQQPPAYAPKTFTHP